MSHHPHEKTWYFVLHSTFFSPYLCLSNYYKKSLFEQLKNEHDEKTDDFARNGR